MASFGTVGLDEVWGALDQCLQGYTRQQKLHNWWVYPPDKSKPPFMLPLGEHGRRRNAETQRGHVKRMARQLGVLDCVKSKIPGL